MSQANPPQTKPTPSAKAGPAKAGVVKKATRAEKVASNRQALLRAGAEIVGERGYEDASIARITERAGLAHGTFYKHFESRQAMFDELLPGMGKELLDEVRELIRGSKDILEVEEKGFRGFFDYVAKHPGFYRVLNEAEVAAPEAFDERELEIIAFVLMAARFYIYLRFSKSGNKAKRIPDWVVTGYMKFVTRGLKA